MLMGIWGIVWVTPLTATLTALAAISLPVVIHLLNRRRYQVVNWAAMRFLLAAQQQRVRKLRLESWLLLLVRILILLALILAMAAVTPWADSIWRRLFPNAAVTLPASAIRTHRILVMDASYSMLTQTGEQTRWESAQKLASEWFQSAAPGDGFSLIVLKNPSEMVVAGPVDDRSKILAEIASMTPSHGNADLASGLNLLSDVLARSPGKYDRREILFASDLQRSTWSVVRSTAESTPMNSTRANSLAELWRQITTRAKIVFADVAQADVDNLAVIGCELADSLPLVGVDSAITATVQNFSGQERKDVRVSFSVATGRLAGEIASGTDAPLERPVFRPFAERTITLPVGGTVSVAVPYRFTGAGDHLFQVRIDSDALPIDDERLLAVQARDTIPVLLVNGKPSAQPLERASEWVARALNPFPAGKRIAGYPARPRTITLAEFADPGLGDLSQVDVVICCDVPQLSRGELARLEGFLRRGGSLFLAAGPNLARSVEAFQQLAWSDGQRVLPAPFRAVRDVPRPGYFSLTPTEESLRRPPLNGFQNDTERASLLSARFQRYLPLDLPERAAARRILNFVRTQPQTDAKPMPAAAQSTGESLEAALVEWSVGRGKCFYFASSLNPDWNSWPLSPSYPPFLQEWFRYAVSGTSRTNLSVGEPITESTLGAWSGLPVRLLPPVGDVRSETIRLLGDSGSILFDEIDHAGMVRLQVPGGRMDRLFAVNLAMTGASGGNESDLFRMDRTDLIGTAPEGELQIVDTLGQIRPWNEPENVPSSVNSSESEELGTTQVGSTIARWCLLILLGLLVLEMLLAWRFGTARSHSNATMPPGGLGMGWWLAMPAMLTVIAAGILVFVAIQTRMSGNLLGGIPESLHPKVEQMLGMPPAAAGEQHHWMLESLPIFSPTPTTERWILISFTVGLCGLIGLLYGLDFGLRRLPGRFRRGSMVLLAMLRLSLVAVILSILLPQLRLLLEREGLPELVVVIDDSRSMGTVDPTVAVPMRDRLASLIPGTQASQLNRLQLAQAIVAEGGPSELARLIRDRRVKLHIYRLSEQAVRLGQASEESALAPLQAEISQLTPTGTASQLGEGLTTILKSFRGASLTAAVVFTDGISTAGGSATASPDDLRMVGKLASRMGVPLFFVGLGDDRQPFDVALSDLQVEEVVNVNDRLVFEARLTVTGTPPSGKLERIPVILSEKQGDQWIERSREMVQPELGGKPVRIRLIHAPTETGDKQFELRIPVQTEERDLLNNRLERAITVMESRTLRVLLIEGTPRYEYRFLKTLLEREVDPVRGQKTVQLSSLLLDAHPEYSTQDRTALSSFPTQEELNTFDVVILGDCDPKQIPGGDRSWQMLVDFVRERGGGLVLLAGTQGNPRAYEQTPLAAVLPVTSEGIPPPLEANPLDALGANEREFRPELTPTGLGHPIFRFAPDDAENAQIWSNFPTLNWVARGYRRKLAAEVLAVHPDLAPEVGTGTTNDTRHPIVVQQFVGSGRVLFLGIDETWRWRYRKNERMYNQFWIQVLRAVSRNRLSKIDLRLDRQSDYRRDEPIRVMVRFPDDAPAPLDSQPVQVQVTRQPTDPAARAIQERDTQLLTLAKREGTRATFESLLTRTPEGEYRFELVTPPTTTSRPAVTTRVLPPAGEMDELRMNRVEMERAAAESRGQFLTLADVDTLIDRLPEASPIPLNQPRPPWIIWNHSVIFALMLGLFGIEWLARKRLNLV
ncbi:VWA domain-containing protein [Tuwongella immobilis]|uniref:VWFA domain-containing protein n=1 Tax=Tuwongella immobilis TaxID=692036 RepID=A0A6C2YPC1_9BACT|nr:VWA domain-containing protein [Tuwongella immobilis]VIP03296.1 Uncultured bacterium genome assembly Metasoil_fosmids_resub OS=uncultured bacterium PE=4 SV=1: BatA: VWA_2: VWA_2: DUF1355 [Tuwongella immobilis]VTS03963.1 Uncultured bacterium genome assembly Metasoil_fosmids_resub OS=uncultured bacterium PE=4 SV=1: BatA: VWA_2: VWA_2: DUF1355 [Tuwongella immobilis]